MKECRNNLHLIRHFNKSKLVSEHYLIEDLEPHTYEQCFNAHKVLTWEVGAAMYPKKLTKDGIAKVLAKKVLTQNYQQRAKEIKLQINNELGINQAGNLIETWLS